MNGANDTATFDEFFAEHSAVTGQPARGNLVVDSVRAKVAKALLFPQMEMLG